MMINRMQSSYEMIGLPDAFGTILLILFLILTIAPYAAGKDFGVFKVPTFSESGRKKLKIAGPVCLAICILLFLPIWRIVYDPGASLPGSQDTVAAPAGESRGTQAIDSHENTEISDATATSQPKGTGGDALTGGSGNPLPAVGQPGNQAERQRTDESDISPEAAPATLPPSLQVFLYLPRTMTRATILVDGQAAAVVARTPVRATIQVSPKAGPHVVVLESEWATCKDTRLIVESGVEWSPCITGEVTRK